MKTLCTMMQTYFYNHLWPKDVSRCLNVLFTFLFEIKFPNRLFFIPFLHRSLMFTTIWRSSIFNSMFDQKIVSNAEKSFFLDFLNSYFKLTDTYQILELSLLITREKPMMFRTISHKGVIRCFCCCRSFKADCLARDLGLWVECPPWRSV